jgi:hypothetical protein
MGNRGNDMIPNTEFKLTQFGLLETVERTPILELKSIYGLSTLRDITTVAGSGTVSHGGIGVDSEYTVATTASGTDSAILDSAERGRYQPGTTAEVGMGVRLSQTTLTGNQKCEWGAFNANNGFVFGLDATGFYIAIRKNGVDNITRQDNFNRDSFNGSGQSGLVLDLTDGNIFQVDYAWYGYGTVVFKIISTDHEGKQQVYTLHEYTPDSETSISNPNLPIRASVSNGGTAAAHTMYVAGRQFSILGRNDPNKRSNGHFRSASLGTIGTTFLPVLSFRRKTGWDAVSAFASGFEAIADADLYWQIRLNGSLTGPVWGTPANTTATETCMEVDTTATAITGGQIISPGGIIGASAPNRSTISAQNALALVIPSNQPVTICVRRVTGTNATLNALVADWREEW